MTKNTKPAEQPEKPDPISPERAQAIAQVSMAPEMRHAAIASAFASPIFGGDQAEWKDNVEALRAAEDKVVGGDLALVSRMLVAQATTLDTIFTEMSHRAAINMGKYPQAAERYVRLALKAQSNSRATLEAVARIHQPREQTVKHVTVHEGGQAVVADHVHHHYHRGQNENTAGQPFRAGDPGEGTPMLGQDTAGYGVPIPGNAERPVQNTRREVAGGTQG